ncbi:MAG: glucosamine-6-phosphate deaminase [Ilumatobacteraceae bacterium]
MEVVILADAEAVGEVAAGIVERLLVERPDAVIGVATGSSPIITYRRLVDSYVAGRISFAAARAVLLDEYVGLSADHPQSYRRFVHEHLADHVDLPADHIHAPDVDTGDPASAGGRFEAVLAELGGVDVQLLGIGTDGHIGFNEPGSSLRSRTRIKTLTAETRADNARFFDSPDDVPRHVMTQGLATIGDARHLVLVACGSAKAAPVAAAVEGPLTAMCPASILQWHPHATVVVDEAAASALAQSAYYRETHAGKPPWQHY